MTSPLLRCAGQYGRAVFFGLMVAATQIGGAHAATVTGMSPLVKKFEVGPYVTGTHLGYDEVLTLSIGATALAAASSAAIVAAPVRGLRLSYDIDLDTGIGTATDFATDGSYSYTYTAGPGGFVLNDNRGTPMEAMKGAFSIDADSIIVTEFLLNGVLQSLGGFPDFGEVGLGFFKDPTLFGNADATRGRWTSSGKHSTYVPIPAPFALLAGGLFLLGRGPRRLLGTSGAVVRGVHRAGRALS